ncbi:hypothetical protein JB92DRAFT_3103586 [Gautieria morchelliformis]|nr:hypothetical protein JB92DRAFT_3103586 [Gautieria morchelliformis]
MATIKRKPSRPSKVPSSLRTKAKEPLVQQGPPQVSVSRPRPTPTWESAVVSNTHEEAIASDTRPRVATTTKAEIEVGKALVAMFQGEGADIRASALRGMDDVLEKDIEGMDKDAQEAGKDLRELGVELVHNASSSIDEDEDESVQEVAVWDIPFQVPTGPKTIDTLKIASDTSWASLQQQIADIMDIAMKRLSLAYKLSTETKDAPARVLNMLAHWLELKDRATEIHEDRLRQQGEEKGKGKAKGKVDLGKKRKLGNNHSDSDTISDGDDGNVPGQARWVLALQQKYMCQEHGGDYCKVGFGGVHMKLKSSDLSLWGLLLEKGKADKDLDELPMPVGPLDARVPARGRTGVRDAAPAPPAPPSGPLAYAPPAGMPAYHPYWGIPPYYHPYPPAFSTPHSTTRASGHTPRTRDSYPSSDIEDIEDPTLFPRIEEWLTALDQGPLSQDGHAFAPHVAALLEQGYIRISQLADELTVPELQRHCQTLPEGTAKVILKQATKQVARIRRNQEREKRHAKHRRYA